MDTSSLTQIADAAVEMTVEEIASELADSVHTDVITDPEGVAEFIKAVIDSPPVEDSVSEVPAQDQEFGGNDQ